LAWKVSVYIIKPASSQAGFSSQKVYHVPIGVSLPRATAFLVLLRANRLTMRACEAWLDFHESLRFPRADFGPDDF
jgi:hypothetical protein